VYLDSAATSQKPERVLDTMDRYYRTINANVHRGVYAIAEQATDEMERSRAAVARFVGAPSERGLVFTRNATEAINLVAYTWGRANLAEGDVVVLTQMEHHANIVPWHQLAAERGIELRWIPLTTDGHLDLTDLPRLLEGASLLGVTAMSNVLGTITPVRELTRAAHHAGALALVDACQYVPHVPTDVTAWDADFVAFSAHKMCGPTGVGALWGREELLDAMPPFLGGGEMIRDVRLDGFTPNELPWKFEAGTPAIAEAIAFGTAVAYLDDLGMDAVRAHEIELTGYAMRTLADRFGDDITIHGPSDPTARGGVLS
jgi:cysteine desulfurase/selenocysteine lyase